MAARTFDELSAVLKPELAAASIPEKAYQGYYFVALPVAEHHQFCVAAVPAQYGTSGKRTFIAVDDGSIYAKDLAGESVKTPPPNPEKEGWSRIRGKAKVTGPDEEGRPPG